MSAAKSVQKRSHSPHDYIMKKPSKLHEERLNNRLYYDVLFSPSSCNSDRFLGINFEKNINTCFLKLQINSLYVDQ